MDAEYVMHLYASGIKDIVQSEQRRLYHIIPIMEPEYDPLYNILLNLSRRIPELFYKAAEHHDIADDIVEMLKTYIPDYTPRLEEDIFRSKEGDRSIYGGFIQQQFWSSVSMMEKICKNVYIRKNLMKINGLITAFGYICHFNIHFQNNWKELGQYHYNTEYGKQYKKSFDEKISHHMHTIPKYYFIPPSEINKKLTLYFNFVINND